MLRSLALATIAFAVMTAPATAKPIEVLTPESPWEINYDANSCHLLRAFGKGDQQVVVRFSRYRPSRGFKLALYGKRFKSNRPFVTATGDFSSNGSTSTYDGMMGKSGDMPVMTFPGANLADWSSPPNKPDAMMPEMSAAEERAVASVTFNQLGSSKFRIELGPMNGPMNAMRKCVDDLVRSWGFDPAVQTSLSKSPVPINNPNNWLREKDYPRNPGILGYNGIVDFRLDIEIDGRVSKCDILNQTKPEDFAAVTCAKLMERARFEPALDASGKPIKSYFVSSVTWYSPPNY